MKSMNKKMNCLLGAIVAASGASIATAGNIYVEASGVAVTQGTSVQNVPGVPSAVSPPLYQEPRMQGFGGAGWASKLSIVIDDATGAVTDYKVRLNDPLGQNFGSGGPQYDIRSVGRTYTFANDFDGANCTVGPAAIAEASVNASTFPGAPILTGRGDIPGGGDGNTLDGSGNGTLVYHCTVTTNVNSFAKLFAPNHACATPNPTSLVPGQNGCGAQWSGFLAGSNIAVAPVSHLPANHINVQDPGGLAWDVTGFVPNPEVFRDTDPKANFVSKSAHEFQGGRAGGTFLISHTGTLDDGTFAVTGVQYYHDTNIIFPIVLLGPTAMGHAQSFSRYDFNASVVQSNSAANAKNVPAMGAFGLAALFGGLVAVAARLRRRVS